MYKTSGYDIVVNLRKIIKGITESDEETILKEDVQSLNATTVSHISHQIANKQLLYLHIVTITEKTWTEWCTDVAIGLPVTQTSKIATRPSTITFTLNFNQLDSNCCTRFNYSFDLPTFISTVLNMASTQGIFGND